MVIFWCHFLSLMLTYSKPLIFGSWHNATTLSGYRALPIGPRANMCQGTGPKSGSELPIASVWWHHSANSTTAADKWFLICVDLAQKTQFRPKAEMKPDVEFFPQRAILSPFKATFISFHAKWVVLSRTELVLLLPLNISLQRGDFAELTVDRKKEWIASKFRPTRCLLLVLNADVITWQV